VITPDNYRLKTGPQDSLLGPDLGIGVLKIRPARRTPRPDLEDELDLYGSFWACHRAATSPDPAPGAPHNWPVEQR
jgi:hypothetical protein